MTDESKAGSNRGTSGTMESTSEVGWTPIDPLGSVGTGRSFVSGEPDGDRLRVCYYRRDRDGALVGKIWFGPGAEGPPGHAHGGSMAAVLDEAMGAGAWLAGHASRERSSSRDLGGASGRQEGDDTRAPLRQGRRALRRRRRALHRHRGRTLRHAARTRLEDARQSAREGRRRKRARRCLTAASRCRRRNRVSRPLDTSSPCIRPLPASSSGFASAS